MNNNLISIFKRFNPSTDLNRRSDTRVRTAIDDVQDLLFDPQASAKIFPLILKHLTCISESDCAAIITADAEGKTPIISGEDVPLMGIYGEDYSEFVSIPIVSCWVKEKIIPLKPIFFNGPISKFHSKLFISEQKFNSIMILPIISQYQLRGICILGKRTGVYSGDALRRIMPLLGSVVCALQSADSVKGNIFNLNKKLSDNRFLSTLLSTSPIAIMVVDQNKRVVISNPIANQMFALPALHRNKDTVLELNDEANSIEIDKVLPNFDDLFQWSNQRSRYGEDDSELSPRVWENQNALSQKGRRFLVNLSVFRYTYASQRYTALQIQDISAMREHADEYQQATQQLNALTHLVPVGILRVNANWTCVYANDKWYEFTGLTRDESSGRDWINAIHGSDVQRTLESLREAIQAGRNHQAQIRLVSPLGQVRWVDFNIQVLYEESGVTQGFLATFADITEQLLHQERLRQFAEYDGLTGLANRNLFQDRLQQAFFASDRNCSELTVMFLDLDGFKDINDSLGHPVGDKMLQHVSERLLNTLRRNDTVARFGGDEFVVLLASSEGDMDITNVADKIIQAIAQPYNIDGHSMYVTVSIGISTGSALSSSPEQILKEADAALYLAKFEGKNNFQLFNETLDRDAKKRVNMTSQLKQALIKERFHLVYQPQSQISDDQVVGFEALLRFTDDEGSVINPDDFIPILEETGLIIDVGKWVIDEGCKQLRLWQNLGLFPENGFLSINVSPKQLLDSSIITTILNACNRYQIEPQQLVIELTETVIINKPQNVKKAMDLLKDVGVTLALDDFGTGYSSLTYLQRYPFDHIKIDKSFVSDLMTDENDAKITKAIIALAQSLGLKITAEGVGDLESLNKLREYGADFYQGYFLGRPSSPQEAIKSVSSPADGTEDELLVNSL